MQGNPGKSPEKLAPEGAGMYKKDRFHQFGLSDFNQPFGLKMNPENRWVRKSEMIPWEAIEDRDNADRVEVERAFSLAKRSYGLGCIRTKLADTTGCSIALSIIAMNIARLTGLLLCRFLKSIFSRYRVYKSTFCTRYLLINKLQQRSFSNAATML